MKKLVKSVVGFLVGFLLFVAIGFYVESSKFRNTFGGTTSYNYDWNSNQSNRSGSFDFAFANNNYASKKLRVEKNASLAVTTAGEAGYMVDQKYQKIATIGAETDNFEQHEQQLKQAIKNTDALIQYEKNFGHGQRRQLQMAIGVHPDDFDGLVDKLKTFGKLEEFRSDVTDKTNEFQQLQAQRESKIAFRNSLMQLKSRSGKIEELINLEDRILNVEQELQGLGVNLGEFDSENEFSTIKFTLREHVKKPVVAKNLFLKNLVKAIEWAVIYYGITLILFCIFLFGSWLVLRVMNELKIIQRMYRMLNDD